MTLQQNLSAHYDRLDRAFHLHWMEVLRHYGPETAHDLRVNLKRQNAFFHLLEAVEPWFRAGIAMDTFEEIYSHAGKVRNLQVEKQLIEKKERKLQQAHRLSAWLEQRENRNVRLLQQYRSTHSITPVRELSSRVLTVIQFLDAAAAMPRMRAYFLKLIRAIADFARRPNPPAEHLHDLRKFIKELCYNLEFLQRHFGEAALQYTTLNDLDQLQHSLGKWHDHDFTLLHLTRKNVDHNAAFFATLKKEGLEWEKRARGKFGKLEAAMMHLEARIDTLMS